MAKNTLSMTLFYKGKKLNFAKSGVEFKNKFYIGQDKFLFWQILDSKFPDKHLFIKKKDEKYYVDLLPNMDIKCTINNEELNKDALKSRKLLSGSEVTINNEMNGSVQIAPDWSAEFCFVEPYSLVLTEAQQKIADLYARRAELDPFEKFTRNFLIAATAVTLLGIILFDIFKPKDIEIETLEQRWEQIQAVATAVTPASDISQPEVSGSASTEPAPQVAETTTKGTATGTGTSGTMSKAAAKTALSGLLGDGGFNPGSTGSALVAVTAEENIVAASLGGGRGGGGGGGAGKGPGAGGATGGAGGGAGVGSVFDPSAVSSGTTNLAGLSSGRPQGQLSTQAPSGNVTTIVGDVGRIVPVGRPATKVSAGVVSRFSGPEVKKIAEGSIAAAPPETRSELQRIEQKVARYKPQIKDLFNRMSQIKSMYGTIRFTLYIEENGSVADVSIVPISGEFYPEFLSELQKLIKGWRFDNKNLVPYEFSMIFTK